MKMCAHTLYLFAQTLQNSLYLSGKNKQIHVLTLSDRLVIQIFHPIGYFRRTLIKKMGNQQNIRIKDIAKMAGVSVGTVDRVLHGRGKVSEAAKQKVQEVLDQTGYQPNLLARTLGSNKHLKIVTLIPDPSSDEYWDLCHSGIENALEEWGPYNIEIERIFFDLYHSEHFSNKVQEILDMEPTGVLFAPVFHQESLHLINELKVKAIPYVLFNTKIPEAQPISFIGQNLYQSGCLAAELLNMSIPANGGDFAILHVLEDVANSVHLKAKEDGFKDFIQSHRDGSTEVTSLNLSSPDRSEIKKQIDELFKTEDVKGVFVTTSKGANIAASAIKELGHQVSLVGYDLLEKNIDLLEKGSITFLINQNPKGQARIGIAHLANYLLFSKEPSREDLFPLEVITRQNLQSYLTSRIH